MHAQMHMFQGGQHANIDIMYKVKGILFFSMLTICSHHIWKPDDVLATQQGLTSKCYKEINVIHATEMFSITNALWLKPVNGCTYHMAECGPRTKYLILGDAQVYTMQ